MRSGIELPVKRSEDLVDTFSTRLAQAYGRQVGEEIVGNFDADRWAGLPSSMPRDHENAWSAAALEQLLRDPPAFSKVYELFVDEQSRGLFIQLVLYRLLGHRHVRLPRNNDEHWAQRERAQLLQGAESKFGGLFGKLHRFEVEFEGQQVLADCWWMNTAWTFLIRQYYLERNDVLVRPLPRDCVIDAGACFGDTALAFAATVGEQGRVYAFEIDPLNLEIARHNFSLNPQFSSRITLRDEALGDTEAQRYLYGSGPGAQVLERPGGRPVNMTTIDRFVEGAGIKHVDFIKMDIEGAEFGALQGAASTIARFKPRLAISLYHRPDDLLRIPLWLSGLDLGYEFFLEHYTIHYEETVLYARLGRGK